MWILLISSSYLFFQINVSFMNNFRFTEKSHGQLKKLPGSLTQFPLMFTSYIVMVRLPKLKINIYTLYAPNSELYLDFPNFSTNLLFSSWVLPRVPCWILLSYLLSLFRSVKFFSLSLFFMASIKPFGGYESLLWAVP